MSQNNTTQHSFRSLLSELMSGQPIETHHSDLSYDEFTTCMQQGRIVPISEETWWEFLEILPPRWMNANAFAFAEGGNAFRLYWKQGGQHFVRQLSEVQTDCSASCPASVAGTDSGHWAIFCDGKKTLLAKGCI